jgi:predicted TIM-barrel fold metal-dependent hydrolase
MRILPFLLVLLFSLVPAGAEEERAPLPEPVVDAHLHYKWNQAEVTSPEQAIAALRDNGVELAVVTGTPPELALKLHELAPDLILPIFSPYRDLGQWYRWQFRPDLVEEAREAIQQGPFRGIGELHLVGGFAMRWRQSQVLRGLLAVAAAHDLPVLIHMEFSTADPTLSLCRGNPGSRIVLAHAGTVLPISELERILDACPKVWMDLSARDPWRYVRNPIADDEGRLLPEWEALVLEYPRRFVIGSDAVWPVERLDAWDQADTGWAHIGDFLAFHRRWASFLPPEVAAAVLRENARELFTPDFPVRNGQE